MEEEHVLILIGQPCEGRNGPPTASRRASPGCWAFEADRVTWWVGGVQVGVGPSAWPDLRIENWEIQ